MATKMKAAKVVAEVVFLAWKAMEDFQALEIFVDEKSEFAVESYTVGIQECQSKVAGHYQLQTFSFYSMIMTMMSH